MSNRPVVHFERGDRHQYATVLENEDPPVFSHHCIRDGEEFIMTPAFYAYNPNSHMTPEEFKQFLEQSGVDCSPQ
jgi:hypothetical protein